MPNTAWSGRLGKIASSIDYDTEGPFPFDVETGVTLALTWEDSLEIYATRECPFWEGKTGVGQLAQVLFRGEKDLVAMLAFYGDGSGEHGKGTGKFLVVAGYLASTLDWFQVERDWVRALNEHPRIEYFKARECIKRRDSTGAFDFSGQLKGWDDEAVEAKRLKFAEVIHAHNSRIVELSSTVRWDEYESAIGDDMFKKVFFHPYHLCFHGITSLAVDSANHHFRDYKERIAFVFDTETPAIDDSLERYYNYSHETIPKAYADRLGSVTWCTDLHFPMLQVADLLAWSLRAEKEGLVSPVLDIIRDTNRIGGAHSRPWNGSGMAQFVIDKEEAFYKQFPQAKTVND